MDIRRILKMLRARWWVILLAAIGGGVIGVFIALNLNSNIQPQWKAEAPVAFAQLDGGAESTVDVDAELTRAQLLLEETLLADPGLSIEVDPTENMLLFAALKSNGEQALTAVLSLRGEYQALGVTVLSRDQIEATMAAVLLDIDRLRGQVAELVVAEPEAEDSATIAQRAALQSEIGIFHQRQAQLQIWLRNPELRPTEGEFAASKPGGMQGPGQPADGDEEQEPVVVTYTAISAEIAANKLLLARLQASLTALPDPPEPQELDGKTTLELEALQLDIAELEAQYIELLRRGEGKPAGGLFIEPAITDDTTSERPLALSGLIGFLVGGILASGGLIRLDRTRGPMWTATDLKGVVSLGVINRDRTDGLPDRVWYPDSVSQRRRDIQTLRAATDAVTGEQPAIVGFSGVGVADNEVGEVAADLAAAYAVAGRKVLLIDGNAFHPNTLPEFGSHADGLIDILTTQMPSDDATDAINRLLDETPPVMTCLTALTVEGNAHDPIDAFASQNYRLLMDIAKSRYDIVIHAGPDAAGPLSDAVVRRVDYVVLVGSLGMTTVAQITTAANVLTDRRAELAGAVLLEGRRQPLSSQLGAIARGDAETLATSGTQRFAQAVKKMRTIFNTPHTYTEPAAKAGRPQSGTEKDEPVIVTVEVLDAEPDAEPAESGSVS